MSGYWRKWTGEIFRDSGVKNCINCLSDLSCKELKMWDCTTSIWGYKRGSEHPIPVCVCVCVGGGSATYVTSESHLQLDIRQPWSPPSWPCLSREGIRPHSGRAPSHKTAPPPSDVSGKSQLSPRLLADQLEIGGSNDPPASINLPEKLLLLRETFYLLDYQFIMKICNLETDTGKKAA